MENAKYQDSIIILEPFLLVWRFWQWTWILQKAYNLSRKYKDAINEYKVLANITMMTARLGKPKKPVNTTSY